jgi:hypothetical protein
MPNMPLGPIPKRLTPFRNGSVLRSTKKYEKSLWHYLGVSSNSFTLSF